MQPRTCEERMFRNCAGACKRRRACRAARGSASNGGLAAHAAVLPSTCNPEI